MIMHYNVCWFLEECAKIRGIGQYQCHIYEEAINEKQPSYSSTAHLLNLIDLGGFEREQPSSSPDEKQLPMAVLTSDDTLQIIYAKKNSGEWLLRSFKGEKSINFFERGTQFISLIEKRKVDHFTKIFQTFRSVIRGV
jgi:hypothetical protein